MDNTTLSIEYQKLADRAAADWKTIYVNGINGGEGGERFTDVMEKRIRDRIDRMVEQSIEDAAIEKINKILETEASRIAGVIVDKWAEEEKIVIDEPTPKIKAAVERAFSEVSGRYMHFINASRQKKVQALALHEAKVPMSRIAKELGCTAQTVKKWIKDEIDEFDDIKKALSVYGYHAVKNE